ncbi:MAG: nicotinamide-nucleotide adenylyltransferase [Thermoproteota archaeon]|jgi:nicotinamide-nucleotide adenylyltransferase
MEVMSWALYVGRFQPFHKGHLYAVKRILEEEEKLIILIGSSLSSHEIRNPFTLGERIQMILLALDDEKIDRKRYLISSVPDTSFHPSWVTHVKKSVPYFYVVYTNDALTRVLFQEEGYIVKPVPLLNREIYSGTEIRRRIISGEEWAELVPKSVYDFIISIGGDARIRALNSSDSATRKSSNL